jgi:hypothetical protein
MRPKSPYKLCFGLVPAIVASLYSYPASAYDWVITAHVTGIEGSHIPISLNFLVDQAGGSCAAGTYLSWIVQGPDPSSQADNVKAVFTQLITAKVTGQTVALYGNNSGCTVGAIHFGI